MGGPHMVFSHIPDNTPHTTTRPAAPAVFLPAPDPIDAHDDDYAANADDRRDELENGWTPRPENLA